MTKKASSAALSLVASCAFKGAKAHAAIVAAITAAGGTGQKAVRNAFVNGWAAGIMNPEAVALSPAMLATAGGKAAKGSALAKAQAAARKQWSRMLVKAGAKTTDKRGGSRATRMSKANAPKPPKAAPLPKATEIAAFADRGATVEWMCSQMALIVVALEKTAKADAARVPAHLLKGAQKLRDDAVAAAS